MSILISIVGVSGVGKTTLARALCEQFEFAMAYEQHAERPFQALFKQDARYALANQLDYLLFRAEQERALRNGDRPALMDGGFDLDFYGFTRLFHAHGWLTSEEFELCRRFYKLTRELLPPPELVIALNAEPQVVSERLAARNRINIASEKDAGLFKEFLDEWLESLTGENLLQLNVSLEDPGYNQSVPMILERIRNQFNILE